jgi:FdrA protein
VTTTVRTFPDTYVDSVAQLAAVRAMRLVDGVDWASAGMMTPANAEALRGEGVEGPAIDGVGPNDFFVVVRAVDDAVAREALEGAERAVFAVRPQDDGRQPEPAPRSVDGAVKQRPEANVAVISVPGEYAALPTYQALRSGLHVLLFSDNVPLAKEIRLKDFARARGLLVMGPGAGTAMLGGVGLGFANVVAPGRVGVVAAAGTGAQEVMCLLDRWGAGISHVLGLGGRDMSGAVDGRTALPAVAALREDPGTDVILLVSKPPDGVVAARALAAVGGKPMVAALLGIGEVFTDTGGAVVADTLEGAVVATLRMLGLPSPDTTATTLGPSLLDARRRLGDRRTLVRGLFSGGTLCYESLVVLGRKLGEVRSNAPIDQAWGMPAPPGSHQCLDLGDEEYTRGRPHPMIDAEARLGPLREHGEDPEVAAIILDVVLGHGAHEDPAGVLAPRCQALMASGGPQVVAYVLGTDADPQGLTAQRRRMAEAGCIVTATAARASAVAAAVATGRPEMADEIL